MNNINMINRAAKAANIITADKTPFPQSTKGKKFDNIIIFCFGYLGEFTNYFLNRK
jgi:hypothetical protein